MTETAETTAVEQEQEPAWKRWLPWLVLVIVVLIVAWLIWLYADFRKPDDGGVAQVTGASVRVPDVVGLDARDAKKVLGDAGLAVEEDVSHDPYSDPGTVSSQSPSGGSRVPPGALVTIDVVSDTGRGAEESEEPDYMGEAKGMTGRDPSRVRMVRVPDIVGQSEKAAGSTIRARGLLARPMYQPNRKRIGKVAQQAPEPGKLVPAGSQVHYLVFVAP